MQRKIQSEPHQPLNSLKDSMKVESIDYSSGVNNMLTKTEKLEKLYETGKMDFNLIKVYSRSSKFCIPGTNLIFTNKTKIRT